MRWLVAALALAACHDQRATCTQHAPQTAGEDVRTAWIDRCVNENWSEARMRCMRNGVGSLASMFCE